MSLKKIIQIGKKCSDEEKTTPPFGHPSRGGDFTRVPNANLDTKCKSSTRVPSPPSEGCPKDGVAKSAHCDSLAEGCPKDGVANSAHCDSFTEGCPKDGVANSAYCDSLAEGCPKDGVAKSAHCDSLAEGCPQDGVENSLPLTYIKEIPIYRYFTVDLPCNHNLMQRARELRKAGNLAEVLFWKRVHKGMFYKIDFDRQKVIGSYIVDFYVKCLSLIVEIDGLSHLGKEKYDAERQGYLESLGLTVYRIKDSRVLNDIENVMCELEVFVSGRYGRPSCLAEK